VRNAITGKRAKSAAAAGHYRPRVADKAACLRSGELLVRIYNQYSVIEQETYLTQAQTTEVVAKPHAQGVAQLDRC